jgi:hypothetical protein
MNPLVVSDPSYKPQLPLITPLTNKNVVYNTTTVNVIEQTSEGAGSGSNSGMIAAIASIVSIIVVGSIAGYFIYKKYQRKILELAQAKAKPVDQSHSTRAHINQSCSPEAGSPGFDDDEKFEEQYHPHLANLDIFGNGDILKKGNDADHVMSEQRIDSSSEEGSSARGSGGSSGASNADGAAIIEGANTLIT